MLTTISKIKAKQFPLAVSTITIVSILIGLNSAFSMALQFDRTAIVNGELWRLLTGHFCHWNLNHLFWDLTVFTTLGSLLEKISNKQFLQTFFFSAFTISIGCWILVPNMETYRGLSGIDTALFSIIVFNYIVNYIRENNWKMVSILLVCCCGFILKTIFEFSTDATMFVETSPLFVPVVLTHVLGFSSGAIIFALNTFLNRKTIDIKNNKFTLSDIYFLRVKFTWKK